MDASSSRLRTTTSPAAATRTRRACAFEIHFDAQVRAETYPGGEVAVLRGPLQFVRPIAHKVRALADLALPGWRDEELLPCDIADVAAATPVHLVRPGLDLVPIGCAPLRRAAFLAASKD